MLSGEATVTDSAQVSGTAKMSGESVARGNSKLTHNAVMSGKAVVDGEAEVGFGMNLSRDVVVYDKEEVLRENSAQTRQPTR